MISGIVIHAVLTVITAVAVMAVTLNEMKGS